MAKLSIISNPAGIIPASIISATAFAQSRTESRRGALFEIWLDGA
jgi:hypothetical protein